MTPAITLIVLFSALCHASWNALVRTRGDKIVSITLLVAAAGIVALPGLLLVPRLEGAAWPFLITSAIVHTGYNTFLALAYHHGELTRVYPLVRGSAPLTTLVVSLLFLREGVTPMEAVGIVVVGAGIMALALDRGWRALVASPQAFAYAAFTSLCITAYTLSDGLGARHAGSPHSYVIWLFVLDMLPMLAGTLIFKRRELAATSWGNWLTGLAGGLLSLAAYWIAIWAMTVAPIPLVAALRETSILFALLIGVVWLGEKVTLVRAASILTVVCGLALMRL